MSQLLKIDENQIFSSEGTNKQKYRKDLPLKQAKIHHIQLYYSDLITEKPCRGMRSRKKCALLRHTLHKNNKETCLERYDVVTTYPSHRKWVA